MRADGKMKNTVYALAIAFIFGCGVLTASVWDIPENVSAKETQVTEKITGLPSFADIVKRETPAVVNISTRMLVQSRGHRGGKLHPNDPFREFFGDDFFERFFGPNLPQREQEIKSLGSGFIISKDGYILTNNHVVENADEIIVKLSDEREFKAKMVGSDSKTDVALIKIDNHDDLPIVELGNSDNMAVGEWVLAIGNPFGVGQTVTAGIVSAKGRSIGAGPYDDFIQTDASINPGNSGGPLFNVNGEVVGINTAIYSTSGGSVGIGFAIPINLVKSFLPDLKGEGKVTRGWLGVMIQPLTKELAESFELPSDEGALVSNVIEKSPAEKGGIKQGDVIIEFNGEKIGKVKELPAVVASTPPGKKVKVKVLREGKEVTLKVKIDKLKDEVEKDGNQIKKMGMSVQKITPELARKLGLDAEKGVLVSKVERGGPAYKGGIRRGDVIIQVNRKEIKNIADYSNAIDSLRPGETALILLIRRSSTLYATIKVGDK